MILIGKKLLHDYAKDHPETKSDLETLEQELEEGKWKTPHELKDHYPKASIIGGKSVVFNISGNRHRLWVQVTYKSQTIVTIKIGTHKEYDKWKIKS
jgi:mRNA interferase HigB